MPLWGQKNGVMTYAIKEWRIYIQLYINLVTTKCLLHEASNLDAYSLYVHYADSYNYMVACTTDTRPAHKYAHVV